MKLLKPIAVVSIVLVSGISAFAQASTETSKREVKIYVQRTSNGGTIDTSTSVKRSVDAKAPLRAALEELFAGKLTPQEEKDGMWSATYGMKFEGVSLKNGTATVRFSQPPDKTNYGSLGPSIFAEAVEKTARQFPSVKRVNICAVGKTMIDSELERPFPRCPAAK